jgi:hypothetical protein
VGWSKEIAAAFNRKITGKREMNFHTLNLWAILVAAASAFVLGGLWYSPIAFAGAWKRANGYGPENTPSAGGKVFAVAFLLSLVMALNLAMFLNDPKTTAAWGATAGFLAGFGWVAMGIGIVSLFERRPFRYVAINGGYLTVALVVMGAILGAWR